MRRRERGAAAVEFALVLPVLLMLVGAVLDFGNMYRQQIQLTNAARDGVRQVVANSASGWSQSQIQSRIVQSASPLGVSSTATAWYCSTSGSTVTVTVTPTTAYSYTVLRFVPGLPVPALRGTATMTCS
ncbi:TadE/TadG family type IV pilus assembly protein [Phycicoccus sp. M110.8]|uniref:TadE/TadG family type IV pilus assembly protein n=1 Tax=Phycicoccus sp. M110.8 TaxID=3075433 RepID=UPI0028FD2D64|nr:TadE/TadG family type IV pilus assembly protein [Phycicoccus sp. M110.8]MDU0312662.1 TadE/TadG family type IV pilus assembly protein [Phycicoccus sp. M110.8]